MLSAGLQEQPEPEAPPPPCDDVDFGDDDCCQDNENGNVDGDVEKEDGKLSAESVCDAAPRRLADELAAEHGADDSTRLPNEESCPSEVLVDIDCDMEKQDGMLLADAACTAVPPSPVRSPTLAREADAAPQVPNVKNSSSLAERLGLLEPEEQTADRRKRDGHNDLQAELRRERAEHERKRPRVYWSGITDGSQGGCRGTSNPAQTWHRRHGHWGWKPAHDWSKRWGSW